MNDLIIGCLAGCGRIRWRRGLCPACYERAKLLVRSGNTSWETVIAEGKALPSAATDRYKFNRAPEQVERRWARKNSMFLFIEEGAQYPVIRRAYGEKGKGHEELLPRELEALSTEWANFPPYLYSPEKSFIVADTTESHLTRKFGCIVELCDSWEESKAVLHLVASYLLACKIGLLLRAYSLPRKASEKLYWLENWGLQCTTPGPSFPEFSNSVKMSVRGGAVWKSL